MAQLVEHILGKDEVTGSSPVISSKDRDAQTPLSFFYVFLGLFEPFLLFIIYTFAQLYPIT